MTPNKICRARNHKVVGSNPTKLTADFTMSRMNIVIQFNTESQFLDVCNS